MALFVHTKQHLIMVMGSYGRDMVDYAKPFIIKINDLGKRRSGQRSRIISGSFA